MRFPWGRLLLVAALVAGCLVLAACGGGGEGEEEARAVSMFRGNPARTGVNPGPGVERSPTLLWRFHTEDDVSCSPAVVDGVLYIGGRDGHVYALDAGTGEELWRLETGAEHVSSPAVADGVVYIGQSGPAVPAGQEGVYIEMGDTAERYVYALDAATGEELWRFKTGYDVVSSPAMADGLVYVGSMDGYVYALDGATGEELWRFETGGWVNSSPAVVDGVVYVGSSDGYLYAITEE